MKYPNMPGACFTTHAQCTSAAHACCHQAMCFPTCPQVSGKPIKFVGTGEKMDALEPFYPERMAQRILGMGDMLTLYEKAQEAIKVSCWAVATLAGLRGVCACAFESVRL